MPRAVMDSDYTKRRKRRVVEASKTSVERQLENIASASAVPNPPWGYCFLNSRGLLEVHGSEQFLVACRAAGLEQAVMAEMAKEQPPQSTTRPLSPASSPPDAPVKMDKLLPRLCPGWREKGIWTKKTGLRSLVYDTLSLVSDGKRPKYSCTKDGADPAFNLHAPAYWPPALPYLSPTGADAFAVPQGKFKDALISIVESVYTYFGAEELMDTLPYPMPKQRAEEDGVAGRESAEAEVEGAEMEDVEVDESDTEKSPFSLPPKRRRSLRKTTATIQAEKQLDLLRRLGACDESGVKVVDVEDKGRGVVATRTYYRHDFVLEYKGETIDIHEAAIREAKYVQDLAVGCYMFYFKCNTKAYCVDATEESTWLGRLVNHSKKNANLQTKCLQVEGKPRLLLVASKTIEAGKELLYDYGERSIDVVKANPWLAS